MTLYFALTSYLITQGGHNDNYRQDHMDTPAGMSQ